MSSDAIRSAGFAKAAARIPAEQEVDIVELPEREWINPNIFAPKLLGIQIQEAPENWTLEYLKMIARYPGQPLPLLPPDLYLEK
ncbi:MAG: hypothetical protein ONB05_02715 [candidate division KSB1 bacterium]|nr:hypothetical protein [candidate division KSB1 bacterium]